MIRNTTKFFGILLSAALVFSSLAINPATAHADTKTNTLNLYSDGAVVPIDSFFVPEENTSSTKIAQYPSHSVEYTIYNGLNNCSDRIDVEKFNVTTDEFVAKLENVINSCPELFYISAEFSYEPSPDGSKVSTFIPQYNAPVSTINSQKAYFEGEMNKILGKIDSSWTELEKVMFVHDYLAQNYEYDTSYQIHDAYNFFVQGKGVCQSYTSVFAGLMKKLGIDVTVAASDPMNHIWNVVKVDDKWYHIDVTWDDPTRDKFSLVSHENFLLSDSQISTKRGSSSQYHYSWVTSYKCTDTKYDNYFWYTNKVTSPFVNLDGKWYYAKYNDDTKDGDIYACDLTNTGTKVASLGKWNNYKNENSYFTSNYCGIDKFEDSLYFNTQDKIYKYSPADDDISEINIPDDIDGKIFGLRIRNNKLYFGVTKDYSNVKIHTLELDVLPDEPIDPSTATLGDVNLDGKVNLNDAKELLKAALGINQLSDDQKRVADLDYDDKINLNDAKLLLKLSLGIITADSLQKR